RAFRVTGVQTCARPISSLAQRLAACNEPVDLGLVRSRGGLARDVAKEPGLRRAVEQAEQRRAGPQRARKRRLLRSALRLVGCPRSEERRVGTEWRGVAA